MKRDRSFKFETLENKRLMAVFLDGPMDAYFTNAFFKGDSQIDKRELTELFKLAGDGNVIDQNEFNDLNKLVTQVGMSNDSLRGVAKNILSSPANKGNDLKVGSNSTDLFRLMDKWLLGKDRPVAASGTYKKVEGNLFVNGPSSADVKQGRVGDCYLVAALASTADKNPSIIMNMFTDNGDETWTIEFVDRFGTGKWDFTRNYVIVDKYLPVSGSGTPIYASFGTHNTSVRNELWVAMLEKGYAQWNETGRTMQGNMTNSYEAISGGWSHVVYAQIYTQSGVMSRTGKTTFGRSELIIQTALQKHQAVTIYRYMVDGVSSGHAYYVESYVNGKYNLRNPWGHSHLTQTFAEMKKDCYGYAIAPHVYWGIVISIPPKGITAPKRQPMIWANYAVV